MAYIPGSMKEYKPSSSNAANTSYIAPDLQALIDQVGPDHTPMAKEVDWNEVRRIRNQKLADTDWVNMGTRSLTFEERHSLYVYRQALRDIPQQSTLVWPKEPPFLKKDN